LRKSPQGKAEEDLRARENRKLTQKRRKKTGGMRKRKEKGQSKDRHKEKERSKEREAGAEKVGLSGAIQQITPEGRRGMTFGF